MWLPVTRGGHGSGLRERPSVPFPARPASPSKTRDVAMGNGCLRRFVTARRSRLAAVLRDRGLTGSILRGLAESGMCAKRSHTYRM